MTAHSKTAAEPAVSLFSKTQTQSMSLNRIISERDAVSEARAGVEQRGIGALASLSTRIADLRSLEAEVERASQRLGGQVTDTFGRPEQA